MGKKQKTIIQIRRELKAKKEEELLATLTRQKRIENENAQSKRKRLSFEELACFLPMKDLQESFIRNPESFSTRRYCQGRQIKEFVDHLLVKYPVPGFLYRSVVGETGAELLCGEVNFHETHAEFVLQRKLFLAFAQGQSLYPILSGVMTRKEVHAFTVAPSGITLRQRVLWAKLKIAGATDQELQNLVGRCGGWNILLAAQDHRQKLEAIILLLIGCQREFKRVKTFRILSFLYDIGNIQRTEFAGRTPQSFMEIVNEHWMNQEYPDHSDAQWEAEFPFWTWRSKTMLVQVSELTSARALRIEGDTMDHCVGSYASDCAENSSRILSVKFFPMKGKRAGQMLDRLTMEVNPKTKHIVQVKGKQNRNPRLDEMEIIDFWASENGIRIPYMVRFN
ncbi:MAG: PcfJ domain-containing protein [Fimbriimonadaceae bacterium]